MFIDTKLPSWVVVDENTTEDTTTSEEGQTSDNTDETIIETETTEN